MEQLSENKKNLEVFDRISLKALQQTNKLNLRLFNQLDLKTFGILFLTLLPLIAPFGKFNFTRKGAVSMTLIFLLLALFLAAKILSSCLRLFKLKPEATGFLPVSGNFSSLEEYVRAYQGMSSPEQTESILKQSWTLSQILKQKTELFEQAVFWLIPFLLFQVLQVVIWSLVILREI